MFLKELLDPNFFRGRWLDLEQVRFYRAWPNHVGSNRMERNRGVNCVKTGGRLPWSTCEQGFVSRGEILYGILNTSVVNF